ncbi:MAG TPA: Rieske 2Fe-2S domain-containing protein [Hyphomicrobiaceae bacterium]|nr:Rieske 2Fe-2S domain-containing protein [Hyphomicrobiaceae bacterium]
MPKLEKYVVARVEEVEPGKPLVRKVKGRDIGIFNLKGEFFALLNRCPHQSAELCRGRLTHLVQSSRAGEFQVSRPGEMLKCPWHGWEFDIRTGQSWCDPGSTYVRQFGVKVEPGETLARGPYVAETFPVTVEGSYIVVEM